MNPKRLLRGIAICGFALLPLAIRAQTEDLSSDSEFFKKQAGIYQQWLDYAGFGKVLKVQTIEVSPQQLSLYLGFQYQDIDTIEVAWKMLKANFERTGQVTLEQELFYKMVNLMAVGQSMASVQIYDTYDLTKAQLFFRRISFKDGMVQVEESGYGTKIKKNFKVRDSAYHLEQPTMLKESGRRSRIKELVLNPSNFKNLKNSRIKVNDFKQKYDRQAVFDKIVACSRGRLERTPCEQRNPKLQVLEKEQVLRFEVTDLCRVVLTDEANPLLCSVLNRIGYDCNWVKREMLIFRIEYQQTAAGFQLRIELDGKYGSGLYDNVRRGGYHSMDIDFEDYLSRYADIFGEYLRQCITQ
jgi:hypothetical protein